MSVLLENDITLALLTSGFMKLALQYIEIIRIFNGTENVDILSKRRHLGNYLHIIN
jgi:hypothetical protein